MIIKIRSNTFESNSSSVHTLSIDKSGREPSRLPINKKTNKVIAHFGNFGKNHNIYTSQEDKLAYLMTNVYYLNHADYNDTEDIWAFGAISDAISNYCGCDGIEIDMNYGVDPYIDHQSIPYGGIEIIDVYDEDSVIDFVFNKYISLKTDCD